MYNHTIASDTTFAGLLERHARLAADSPALVFAGRHFTFAQHAQRIRRLASALLSCNLKQQERFSILAMNCNEYLEAYAAAQRCGLILNAVNFRLAPAEIEWILRDAAPRLLLFESQYTELVESLRARLPDIGTYVCIGDAPRWAENYEDWLESAGERDTDSGRAQDACLLAYTSGTTGTPKGVLHSNRSILRIAEVVSSECRLGGDDRLLAIAPLFHAGASCLSWGAQFRAGCVVLLRGFEAQEVVRVIERERITAIHLVPTMVQALLDATNFAQHDLSSLRMLMYAAAPMPLPLLKRTIAAFGPITYNGYGQTEINLMTLLHPAQHLLNGTPEQVARLRSVGQPHWQSEIRIVSEDGSDCAAGVIGEVAARSQTAMTGYWRNEAATRAALREGWVYTGDLGYLDDSGYLFLVDRKKDMIISGGENVYSREVEEALLQHPAVLEAAVIGVPDAKWGEAVMAVVVLAPGAAASAAELIAHSRTLIAAYKCPKSVQFMTELPRLNTGKINKRALREPLMPHT